jgi:serine/threonine protein kinase
MDRAGAYTLLKELAEGGIGRVFLALRADEEPDAEPCIVKVVHDRFRRNSFFTATLMSEAPAAVRFRHPHGLSVYKVDDVDGTLYIATERASGPNWSRLRDRARQSSRTFSVDGLLYLGMQVAQLLRAGHRQPWANGDSDGLLVAQLAPQSVFLNPVGEAQVLGLGLGRSRTCLPPTRSRLPYRAPELFLREPATGATDVYGLGVVLYDAFASVESFDRPSVAEIKAAVLDQPPAPLSHLPPAVDELIRSMMAKAPDDRPSDWDTVLTTLQRAMQRQPSVLGAEWAEHVRVLFPELFEPESSVDIARRVPRRSVPYAQTTRGGSPDERTSTAAGARPRTPAPRSAAAAAAGSVAPERRPTRAPLGLTAATPPDDPTLRALPDWAAQVISGDIELGPKSYDIDDLALALETGDLGATRTELPKPSTPDAPPPPRASPPTELAGLDDEDSHFDVDSVVNAILSASPRPSAPEPAPPPGPQPPPGPPEPPPEISLQSHRYDETPDVGLAEPRSLSSVSSEDVWGDPPPSSAHPSAAAPEVAPSPPPDFARTAPPEPGSLPLDLDATEPPLTRLPSTPAPAAWGDDPAPPPPPPTPAPLGTGSGWTPPPTPPDGEEPTELQPGDVLQDRYRVIDELGRGGMSIVYRAEHMLLIKEVALKLLRPELSMLHNVVERFQREARSVCRLDDPNIVRVTDFGRTSTGLLYLVMDLIQGGSLAGYIRERGKVGVEEATHLVRQILSGLTHAHRYEIVHRDLKPENIMLVSERRLVKILDFGIAKLGGSDQVSITQAGTVFGTPRYMSPEQAAGEPVDHRTDLYTVGVILYQLLTGRVPFDGESTVQLLAKVLTQPPPEMDFECPNPSVRAHLQAVTLKALAKEPEDRFDSAQAFLEALDGIRVA